MAGITADLEIDYSAAISGADDYASALTSALDTAAQTAADNLQTSVQAALDAVTSTPVDIPVQVDQVAITEAEAAVQNLAATPVDIPIQVDESAIANAEAAVQGLAQPVDIPIEVDTAAIADASAQLDDLANSATSATTSTESLSGASTALEAGTGLAVGEVSGLKNAISELGPAAAGAAVGGVAALGGGFYELFTKGLQAESATQRFNQILGITKDRVAEVHVGDLNTTLEELGKKMGDTSTQVETATATLFQFASNSGASREAAAQFSDTIFALSARAVALNPALGNVSDVAESLSVRIARGGRFAAAYGLSLSAAEINAAALAETHKKASGELTIYEKATAAAQIASERYGNTLNGTINEGAKNAALAQRRLTAEFDQFLEDTGRQLVIPALDAMKAGIPVGEAFARVLGDLGTSVLPLVGAALVPVGVAANALASALELIPGPVKDVGVAFAAVMLLDGPVVAALTGISNAFLGMAAAATEGGAIQRATLGIASGAETASVGVGGFGAAVGGLVLPVGLAVGAAALLTVGLREIIGEGDRLEIKINDLATVSVPELTRRITEFGTAFSPPDGGIFGEKTQNDIIATKEQTATFNDVLEKSPQFAQKYIDAASQAGVSTRDWQAALDGHINKQAEAQAASDAYVGKVKAVANAQDDAVKSLADYAAGTTDAASAVQALTTADNELKAIQDLLLGNFLSADAAQLSYITALQKTNDQLVGTGFQLNAFTQVGRDNETQLLNLGASAESASGAITKAGGSVTDAVRPLQSYRDELQRVHDVLAGAGQDTSFVDGLIGHVDKAIAATQAKAPAAEAAGKAVGDAGAAGVAGTAPAWGVAGDTVGGSSVTGITGTRWAHMAAGAGLGKAGADGVAGTVNDWINSGTNAAGGAAGGIVSQGPGATSAGSALGGAGAGGVRSSRGSFESAGADAAGGVAAGIYTQIPSVLTAAGELAYQAQAKLREALKATSPSQVTRNEAGIPFGQGFALGILDSIPTATAAAALLAHSAVGGAMVGAPGMSGVSVSREVASYAVSQGGSATTGAVHISVPVTIQPPPGMTNSEASVLGQRVGESAAREVRAVIGAL